MKNARRLANPSTPRQPASPPALVPFAPRAPVGHVLKSWPEQFQEVIEDRRSFELRVDDRDFATGDTVILAEYDRERDVHTGRITTRVIGNVFRGEPFPRGYVAFDLRYGGGIEVVAQATGYKR